MNLTFDWFKMDGAMPTVFLCDGYWCIKINKQSLAWWGDEQSLVAHQTYDTLGETLMHLASWLNVCCP